MGELLVAVIASYFKQVINVIEVCHLELGACGCSREVHSQCVHMQQCHKYSTVKVSIGSNNFIITTSSQIWSHL